MGSSPRRKVLVRFPGIFLEVVAIAACLHGQQVRVERDNELRALKFSVEERSCRVTWEVFENELNRGVVRHHAACGGSFADEVRMVRLIAAEVLRDPSRRGVVKTVSWGRLAPDGATDTPMSQRVAAAAFRSPEWDREKGQPRGGDINGFTRKLCNEAGIYSELTEVFAELGLRVSVASVEKVLVLPAGKLPFYGALAGQGARPRDRLPFDCQVWFHLDPASK